MNNIVNGKLYITIGNRENLPAKNCSCNIGKNLSITKSVALGLYEDNSSFECGDDVMISHGVTLRGSDGHAILSSKNEVLNKAYGIKIGNHVWIYQDVFISKNTEIPSGCIVGARSVVTKKFTEENCIIAGTPAKIVKKDIHWFSALPERIIHKETQQSPLALLVY